MNLSRDYDQEHQDLEQRQYAYDVDYRLRDFMVRRFSHWFSEGHALELGCYKGEFSQRILAHFDQLTVVEGSAALIGHCKANISGSENVKYIHNTFEAVQLEEKYDAIFLVHTLEHLDDPQLVLKKINHWLAPQGKLFLAVPNANAASRQIAVRMGIISHNTAVTKGERIHGHRKTYALDSLIHEVKEAGLNVCDQGGIMFKPLANFQMDQALSHKIIDADFLEGCYELGMRYPDLCASIYTICEKG